MAQHVNVALLNSYIKDLIPLIRNSNILVDVDFLFQQCERVSPSLVGKPSFLFFCQTRTGLSYESMLVPGVGLIFECYYYLHGSEIDRELYLRHDTEKTQVSDVAKLRILKRFSLPFAFFVASTVLIRTRGKCNNPMFYASLVDDYFGLSNQGFTARHFLNAGLSLKAYKKLKATKLETFKSKTEDAMKKGLVVGGADNFNQQYWTSKIDVSKTPLMNFNGCVGGVSLVQNAITMPKVDRNLASIVHPDTLKTFMPQLFPEVSKTLNSFRSPSSEPGSFRFFDAADVNRLGIYCVPLKMPEEERKLREYPAHSIGLRNWRPLFIGPMNPAQNEGCWRMFMRLFDEMRLVYESNHYLVMRFDVNIYNIYLRVHFLSFFLFLRTAKSGL